MLIDTLRQTFSMHVLPRENTEPGMPLCGFKPHAIVIQEFFTNSAQ